MSDTYGDLDEEYEFNLSAVRVWNSDDGLTPRPPAGWYRVIDLPPKASRRDEHVGLWLYLLTRAQDHSRDAGFRRHRIARDRHDEVVLLVHPEMAQLCSGWVDDFDSIITDEGHSRIEPVMQFRWARVVTKRAWNKASLERRMELLRNFDCHTSPEDIEQFASQLGWLDTEDAEEFRWSMFTEDMEGTDTPL